MTSSRQLSNPSSFELLFHRAPSAGVLFELGKRTDVEDVEKGRRRWTAGVNGDNRRPMMENGVLKKYGVPATGRLAGPAVGAPARRLPPGKIVASVAHS